MNRPSSFRSHHAGARPARQTQTSRGVSDFLRINDKMAALLPTVARLNSMQQDCAAILPALFDVCSVLSFESGQLTLAVPNAAFASKLKQQLPKLQQAMVARGWQVNGIRLKVQVRRPEGRPRPVKQLVLPPKAISALSSLTESLEDSPTNRELKAALDAMIARHRRR